MYNKHNGTLKISTTMMTAMMRTKVADTPPLMAAVLSDDDCSSSVIMLSYIPALEKYL